MIRWLRSLFARRHRRPPLSERQMQQEYDDYLAFVRSLRHPSVQSYIDQDITIDADIRPSIDEYRRDPKAWKEKHQ
jgi:hypothetical protein